MRNIVLLLLIIFSIVPKCFSQANKLSDEFTFMFYNTENFFDCENDSLTQDDEFTPDGARRWNYNRFYDKADRLAKVILAAGKWNAPIFVGLCEVESQQALEVLVKQTPLNKFNYKIVHKDSPDERGIDVAFIYRSELFKPFDYKAIPLIDPLNWIKRSKLCHPFRFKLCQAFRSNLCHFIVASRLLFRSKLCHSFRCKLCH
jgi:hypothetical protein